MRAVTQIAQPGLELWAVVFGDEAAVRDDLGVPADRGPVAGGGEEGDVDVFVGFEVVGLAGFGVGVEEEGEAVVFLFDGGLAGWWEAICGALGWREPLGRGLRNGLRAGISGSVKTVVVSDEVSLAYLRSNCHGSGDEEVRVGGLGGHHAELGGLDEVGEILDLLGGARLILVLFLIPGVVVSCDDVLFEHEGKGLRRWRTGTYGSAAMVNSVDVKESNGRVCVLML